MNARQVVSSLEILRSASRGQTWIGVMFKGPVLGFCGIEVVGDEKKFPHASDQGNWLSATRCL